MDAEHTPPRDTGFLLSLGRHLGVGVGVVLGVALGFYGIGEMGGAPASDVVIEEVGSSAAEQAAAPISPGTGSPASASPTAATSPDASGAPDEAVSASPDAERIAPAEISIQVLDAVGDGGATAAGVAEALVEAGFDVVVTNPAAVGYEQTTMFFTEGQEPAAQQVATTMGYGVVDEAPDNVSTSIDVHVVVGTDLQD